MSSKSRPNPRSAPLKLLASRVAPASTVLVEVATSPDEELEAEGLEAARAAPAFEADRGEDDDDRADDSLDDEDPDDDEPAPKPRRRSAKAAGRRAVATSTAKKVPKGPPALVLAPTDPLLAGGPDGDEALEPTGPEVKVRRLHRRDLNRAWEFLKLVFRDVNRETVEYQRPRSKKRFLEVYEEEGEQLLFEVDDKICGYAECSFEASGVDNWINPRYFEKRGMRPLYVDELAVHPDFQGKGVGGFMLDQLQHLARVRGCTHLVLEVAENNNSALTWYRRRNFFKLDAAIFLAQKIPAEPELLPPRTLPANKKVKEGGGKKVATAKRPARASSPRASKRK